MRRSPPEARPTPPKSRVISTMPTERWSSRAVPTRRLSSVPRPKGGRIKGASDLVLDLDSVSVEGRLYTLDTQDMIRKGRDGVGKNRRTATFTGGGAAVGAIIGAIAGGGRGAAIGAASGAGAGAGTQIVTKGAAIRIPAETILTFRLDAPLRVDAAN